MKLEPIHFRAIGNLSFGMSVHDVARDCDCSTQAIYRWINDPDFKAALDLEVAKRQAVAPYQIQTIATESFEGQIDAQREIRAAALGGDQFDYVRVLANMTLLKFGARWLDLAGYNAKLKNPAQLAFMTPRNPAAQDCPDELPSKVECGPGDRSARPKSELDPPPPSRGSYTMTTLAADSLPDRLARGLATKAELEEEREQAWSAGGSPASEGQTSNPAASSNVESNAAKCATGLGQYPDPCPNAAERVDASKPASVTKASEEQTSNPAASSNVESNAAACATGLGQYPDPCPEAAKSVDQSEASSVTERSDQHPEGDTQQHGSGNGPRPVAHDANAPTANSGASRKSRRSTAVQPQHPSPDDRSPSCSQP